MPNQRSYLDWACVINVPEDNPFLASDLLASFEAKAKVYSYDYQDFTYFSIVHDKDFKPDGSLKTEHIHIVLEFSNPMNLDKVVLLLCSLFEVPPNCVSADHVKSMAGAVRYLIHADNPDKAPYEASSIVTNAPRMLEDYLSSVTSVASVLDFLSNGGNPLELILHNGRAWWNANRNLVNDAVRYMRSYGTIDKRPK